MIVPVLSKNFGKSSSTPFVNFDWSSVVNLQVAPLSESVKLNNTSLTVVSVINNKSFVGTRVCNLIELTCALSSAGTLSSPFSITSVIIPNLFVTTALAALSATLAGAKYCVVAVCNGV